MSFINKIAILILLGFYSYQSVQAQDSLGRFPKQVYGKQISTQQTTVQERVLDTTTKVLNYTEDVFVVNLQQAIHYANQYNLNLKQAAVNQRLQELTWQQSKSSRLPSLNGDMSLGTSYGRSIDPTTNQFVNQSFVFNNAGLNAQVLLFGWFGKQKEIAQLDLQHKAYQENYLQLKDDISLNVASTFLRILLAKEQVKIALEQIKTDALLYKQTREFVRAGKLPELNLAQMQSQLANDSSTYISAISETRLALLQLQAIMNYDFSKPIDIEVPDAKRFTVDPLQLHNHPEDIFILAQKNRHQFLSNIYQIQAAQKNYEMQRAYRLPSLYLGGNIGTSYSSNYKKITGQQYTGDAVIGYIKVDTLSYPVSTPTYDYTTSSIPYFNQLNNNIRSNIALSVQVPILNGLSARTNIEKAKLGIFAQKIAFENAQLQLRQDIYRAVLEYEAAQQKYMAANSSTFSAKRALDFAIQRYAVGLLSTIEYTQTQNNYLQASYAGLAAKYDMLFKQKILDYYKGVPLKL